MSDQPELLTAIDGPIARITFNRAKYRNALTAGMLEAMTAFLRQVEANPAVRVVVMTGAGEHFMAGGDVGGFAAAIDAEPAARRADFERRARGGIPVFEVMARMPQPIIAKVRGAVAGASVGWVAASDFVLVSDTALFVVAHTHLGSSPDGAVTWHLPRVLGLRKAKEMVMLGDRLSAQEAVQFGLANRLVPDNHLDQETEALAARLAKSPSVALAQAKRLLHASGLNTLAQQMDAEAAAFGTCAASDDFVEGVRAFTEKRKPEFKGR